MFRLILERSIFTENVTLGKFYLEQKKIYVCDSLEDHYRDLSKEPKVFGKTAIPCGIYPVKNMFWPEFKIVTPRFYNVPQFEGIRIHSGLTEFDTLGCPLTGIVEGDSIKPGTAYDSFLKLMSVLGYFDVYEIEVRNI
jgi:hypothetical protein